MNFYYKFSRGSDWIQLSGSGQFPAKCRDVKWTCNADNEDIKIINTPISDNHPGYGIILYADHPRNLYIQAMKMGYLSRLGYVHDSNNFIPFKHDKVITISKAEKTIKVKATSKRKAHKRRITFEGKEKKVSVVKPKSDVDKKSDWVAWQEYYKEKLYRPSVSPHEDYYSQSILLATSPQHAKSLIRRFQAKDPSSMGVDLAADFEMLYNQTKDQIPKAVEKSALHPDNLVEIKPMHETDIPGLVGGIHEEEMYICKFDDGSKSVHKTMLPGDIAGEVGTYETAKIIGWDNVPETIQCDYGKGEGSSQKFINDTTEPMSGYCEEKETTLTENHLNDLSKIFVMDMVLGNFDRHEGNLLIDKDNKVWAIDNENWGKSKNAELHIESLKQYAETGTGEPLPMIRVMENSFGNDARNFKKFSDHVDNSIGEMLNHKDEIIKYWSQYKDSEAVKAGGFIPAKEAIGYIEKNIKYLDGYRNK